MMGTPSRPRLTLGEVRGAIDFDPAALADFLGRETGASGRLDIERIGGGQSNPTYFVTAPGLDLVLRKRPNGPLLPSAHAVDREYAVLEALAATPVPTPRPTLFHADPDILGTPFYLMERLRGRVFHDSALPGVSSHDRRAMYFSMADALAALHAVDPVAVGLETFGKRGDYFVRQLARWSRQWKDSVTTDIPELDEVLSWLEDHLPPSARSGVLTHGDFRAGNMIFHPTEPRVVGILDWELATLGDPLADLGFFAMTWRLSPDEYAGVRGLDHAELGIPSLDEFVARYEGQHRPSGRLRPFHVAFALFRFAIIFVGIADRARLGTASDASAAQTGRLATNFARRALEVARGSEP